MCFLCGVRVSLWLRRTRPPGPTVRDFQPPIKYTGRHPYVRYMEMLGQLEMTSFSRLGGVGRALVPSTGPQVGPSNCSGSSSPSRTDQLVVELGTLVCTTVVVSRAEYLHWKSVILVSPSCGFHPSSPTRLPRNSCVLALQEQTCTGLSLGGSPLFHKAVPTPYTCSSPCCWVRTETRSLFLRPTKN